MTKWSVILFLIVAGSGVQARGQQVDPKLETSIEECLKLPHRDKICDALINLKLIGDDSIEAVKEYIELGPLEYYVLTAANLALTGRLRIKVPIPHSRVTGIIDRQNDSTSIGFSMNW
jgi:hypothetical protein